jgi:hypothetical protein
MNRCGTPPPSPPPSGGEIYRLGCWLLAREPLVHRPPRLLGLGAAGLVEATAQQLAWPLVR